MKKILSLMTVAMLGTAVSAQETYDNAQLATKDLNGTARYVGMGGAMEALGADISTIGSNPAGIGLFRKNQVSLSAGVMAQTDAETYTKFNNTTIDFDGSKSHVSLDQVGFVWSPTRGRKSYINLAFNYHKSADFNQILNAANNLNGASQSKLTAIKYAAFHGQTGGDMVWTGVDANYEKMMSLDENGNMNFYEGNEFLYGQTQKGYIGQYDFNISGSINNRVWLGLTIGLHDVNYKSNSMYSENLKSDNPGGAISDHYESLKIDGTGFDVKAGVIFRPVNDSPFRIGAYLNSPVYYDLTMSGASRLEMVDVKRYDDTAFSNNTCSYDYRLNTAWKAGVSLGHTVGNYLALGATYEYAWYDHIY